jgi:hypothetical protein
MSPCSRILCKSPPSQLLLRVPLLGTSHFNTICSCPWVRSAPAAQHLSTPPTPARHRTHARATRSESLTFAPAPPAVPLTSLRHTRTPPACGTRARSSVQRHAMPPLDLSLPNHCAPTPALARPRCCLSRTPGPAPAAATARAPPPPQSPACAPPAPASSRAPCTFVRPRVPRLGQLLVAHAPARAARTRTSLGAAAPCARLGPPPPARLSRCRPLARAASRRSSCGRPPEPRLPRASRASARPLPRPAPRRRLIPLGGGRLRTLAGRAASAARPAPTPQPSRSSALHRRTPSALQGPICTAWRWRKRERERERGEKN